MGYLLNLIIINLESQSVPELTTKIKLKLPQLPCYL